MANCQGANHSLNLSKIHRSRRSRPRSDSLSTDLASIRVSRWSKMYKTGTCSQVTRPSVHQPQSSLKPGPCTTSLQSHTQTRPPTRRIPSSKVTLSCATQISYLVATRSMSQFSMITQPHSSRKTRLSKTPRSYREAHPLRPWLRSRNARGSCSRGRIS